MRETPKPPLLTIAGFDPSSGAGITADLQVFAGHHHFGISAISALTVQSTRGVRRVEAVDSQVLAETLECLQVDLPPVGIKIGMLASAGNVRVVAQYLSKLSPRPVTVLDPIIRSSSGAELLSQESLEVLLQDLLPLVDWITPNHLELTALIQGKENRSIEEQARSLAARYPGLGIIATGGDSNPPSDLILPPTGEAIWLEGKHVETSATHGTGCIFSSAFLCGLVDGLGGREAAAGAKHYVTEALRQALPRGSGHGPAHILWPLSVPF